MANFDKKNKFEKDDLDERMIEIARVAKVVKGGRRFRFRATIVVGDGKGKIGMGTGKANAVPDAIRKASERARRDIHFVNLSDTTIAHQTIGRVAGARVLLKPASPRYWCYCGRWCTCCFRSRWRQRYFDQIFG